MRIWKRNDVWVRPAEEMTGRAPEDECIQKGRKQPKRKRLRQLFGLAAALLVLGAAGCGQAGDGAAGAGSSGAEAQTQTGTAGVQVASAELQAQAQPLVDGQLQVHFLDVGQADSILIRTGEEAMLVDAGKNESGQAVVSYLREQGIETLDYVIGTHPHEDHIGGMGDVIREMDVKEVILPDKIHTSKTFEDVLDAIEEKGLSVTTAQQGDVYTLGDAKFTILAPCAGKDYGDELNNWSVGIRLVYGDNSFVLTGDAEKEAEADMIASGENLQGDVWKAAHHGSSTSNTSQMLDAVQPTYAVISCGKDNSYGHPHKETLEAFAERGIQVFRTDEQGTIVVTSDGKNLTFSAGGEVVATTGGQQSSGTDGQQSQTSGQVSADGTGAVTSAQPGGQSAESTAGEQQSQSADQTVADGADTDAQQNNQTAESTADPQTIVHITKSGKKYHRAGCDGLSRSDIEVTLQEAKERGYEPCKGCNPPT